MSDPQRYQILRRTDVFQTYGNNKPLAWAFCIFRGRLSPRRFWQEAAALCPSRVAESRRDVCSAETLCFDGCIARMAPRSVSRYKQKSRWSPSSPWDFSSCEWAYREPKRRQWEVLSPGDLPKSQVPPIELGRGARPPVLNPLVIPRSLCAERGGKRFRFSRLFFRTQPLFNSCSPSLLLCSGFHLHVATASQKIPAGASK